MEQVEMARLAAAVNSYRPDWSHASLLSFIMKHLIDRPYRDAAVALTWIATDPATKTPARVLENGPWWAATLSSATPSQVAIGSVTCSRCGVLVARRRRPDGTWVGETQHVCKGRPSTEEERAEIYARGVEEARAALRGEGKVEQEERRIF